MPTTFFVLAGESSGDQHGARLVTALKSLDPESKFIGMGGGFLAEAGMEIAKDLEGMQVTGFWEVAKHYGFFKQVFYRLLDRLKQARPDALICIDYPGFNLRFAVEVRKLGIPVLYYIVPQVWAWKPMRAKKMAQFVDRAYCVFEFEKVFFEKFGLKTTFVGHPLMDAPARTKENTPEFTLTPGLRTVSFLPGSRKNEIKALYQPLWRGFRKAQGEIGPLRGLFSLLSGSDLNYVNMDCGEPNGIGTNWLPEKGVEGFRPQFVEFKARSDQATRELAAVSHASFLPSISDFSVVKSGTSTLEAGLSGNPMCVVYRGSPISYAIAHMLVNIPVFSLVNIVLGQYAVPELLQGDITPDRIAAEIKRGLDDEKYRENQKAALAELPGKLGGPGASLRAAKAMLDYLKGRGG